MVYSRFKIFTHKMQVILLQTNVTVFLLNEFPINIDTCSDTTYAQYISRPLLKLSKYCTIELLQTLSEYATCNSLLK